MTAPLSPQEAATSLDDPEFTPLPRPVRKPGTTGPVPTRIVERDIPFEINADGCFVLTDFLMPNGYGALTLYGKRHRAHRAVWLDVVGQIPADMHLDHLCRNPACINPDHMEVVTPRENILRSTGPSAINARKTHCKRGHEFAPESTGWKPDGSRVCRICKPAFVAAADRPHGTRSKYRSGCKCDDCRGAERERGRRRTADRRKSA